MEWGNLLEGGAYFNVDTKGAVLIRGQPFIEYSNYMDDIYKNIEEQNPNKKRKFFIRERKLNISVVFITQSYFAVSKNIRQNLTHYIVIKIGNKRELQKIVFNHFSDIDFQDFVNLYKKCIEKPYYFLVIDTTFPSDNFLRFQKNLLERI